MNSNEPSLPYVKFKFNKDGILLKFKNKKFDKNCCHNKNYLKNDKLAEDKI